MMKTKIKKVQQQEYMVAGVLAVARREATIEHLANWTGLSRAQVSAALTTLQTSNLVTGTDYGPNFGTVRYYSLTAHALRDGGTR